MLTACTSETAPPTSVETPPPTSAATSTTSSTTTTTLAPLVDDLDTRVTAWIESQDLVGAAAAVAAPDHALSVAAAGWKDRESEILLSAASQYRIASITKMFTAALTMDLVEDGLVGLQDPVSDYLEGVTAAITVEQLLSHTTGLEDTDIAGDILTAIFDPSSVRSAEEVAEDAIASADLNPGALQSYSSLNYIVLGAVIEAVTGDTYEAVLQERILNPVGLDQTGLETPKADLPTAYEHPLPGQPALSLAEFPTTEAAAASWSAGALISTIADLITFSDILFTGQIVTPDSLDLMLDTDTPPRDQYGLGIAAYEIGETTVYGHNGRTIGYATSLRHDPITGTTVVVLSNDGNAPTAEFADELMAIALG